MILNSEKEEAVKKANLDNRSNMSREEGVEDG